MALYKISGSVVKSLLGSYSPQQANGERSLSNFMARRKTINKTNIKRLPGILAHDAWASFTCLKCSKRNYLLIGKELLNPITAYENALWKCQECGFIHSKNSDLPEVDSAGKDLPFKAWGRRITAHTSVATQRFWKAFFTISTEYHSSYWKQCNTCGKILPASAFSRHKGWGALEKQMECRSCKSVINTKLNPKRTKEQLHESSAKRRVADLLLEGRMSDLISENYSKDLVTVVSKQGRY